MKYIIKIFDEVMNNLTKYILSINILRKELCEKKGKIKHEVSIYII